MPCRKDPALLFPMLCLVGLLLCWAGFFLAGLEAGLGWHGWLPSSSVLPVGLVFLKLLRPGKS